MSQRARRNFAATLAGLLLACAACVVPPRLSPGGGRQPAQDSGAPESSRTLSALPRLPRTPLPVRLTALERQTKIELADLSGGRLVVRRAGNLVLASDGQAGQRLEFPGAHRWGEHLYLGSIVAEPHPDGGLRITNLVPLEDYVAGVVAAELSLWSARPAELEAQAIAVRTYAVRNLEVRRRAGEAVMLLDGVLDQAYHGTYQPGESAGAQRAAKRLSNAIAATRGLVLVEGKQLADVRYHASCGGRTADRSIIFPGTAPSASRTCEPCQERAKRESFAGAPADKRPLGWILELGFGPLANLGHSLGLGTNGLDFLPAALDGGGRWLEVRVSGTAKDKRMSLEQLRAIVGHSVLKSGMLSDVRVTPAGLLITGRGRGHGVGLCQEGTRDYAQRGWDSATILRHYYPAMRLHRL
ncbi:MAG: stage II sporulation protein D [Planctomycetota bacterium]